VKSLLARFKRNGHSAEALKVVIQPDAIYLSAGSAPDSHHFPISAEWQSTLKEALNTVEAAGHSVMVFLASQYYQSYQIDKPDLPQAEWPAALPFLLKDLVTERVTEIVADGYALSDGKKAQVYVVSKSLLTPLQEIVDAAGASLTRIVPEDEVWGYAQQQFDNFMLLHRSEKAGFKIGAYVGGKSRFQRVIRGVAAPITGVAMAELQADSLALELQRSTDYLASQLRDVSINHLYTCCDGEEQAELLSALSQRLAIQVLPLHEQPVSCGESLLNTASHLPAEGVNLYPDYLKPKRELFNLKSVLALWLLVVLGMGSVYVFYSTQNLESQARLNEIRGEMGQLTQQVQGLQKKLAAHKPSPAKQAAVERLRREVKAQRLSLTAITQFDRDDQAGYSGIMRSLAELSSNEISLVRIRIDDNNLNLAGLARTPSSVPKWLGRFKQEIELSGRSFKGLVMGRDEDDVITFELTASKQGGQ
jgi:MSHA biogenesis protein MshI